MHSLACIRTPSRERRRGEREPACEGGGGAAMSIYEEKTGADVGAGRLHQSSGVGFGDVGGDDRDGGGSGEPELVVPDYGGGVDAGGNDVEPATATELSAPDTDPSARIAGFKAKREKRETWGLTIVLNVLVVMYVGPQLLAKGDPDVNPLKEYVNGTEQWQWTEAGSYVYAAIWPVVHVADAAIVSSGLQLEDVVAKFQWSAVAACQVPATSVLLWIYFSVAQVMTILTLYAGYGWPCGVLFGAMWLRFLVVGGLCFAREPVEPNARNILMRRPTAYEHRIMMEMTFMVGYVVPFDFYCINEGQWDGKTAGRAGAMLMVFLELAWVALWWSKWGRDGLLAAGAPRVAKSEGKSREDRFADALLFGLLTYPVHGLLHCVFLLPDIPSNDELVTMEGLLRLVDGWWRFCWSQSPILIVFICFRKQIFGVLKVSLQNKQRLQDGAFIAALLVDDGVDDLIYEATELFRAVPFSKITADLLRSSKGTNADYALSQPCKLNSVDFFVSHSESVRLLMPASFILSSTAVL
eukprot:COSAG02_NODE_200_length_29507_cov_440.183487_14_plen_525_part_00